MTTTTQPLDLDSIERDLALAARLDERTAREFPHVAATRLLAEVKRQRAALDSLTTQFQSRCDEPELFVDLNRPTDVRGHLLAMSQAFGIAAEMVREAAGLT